MKNADKPISPEFCLRQDRDGDYTLEQEGGLTKREYFAAMAMQSLINVSEGYYPDNTAKQSFAFADALLKALEENK